MNDYLRRWFLLLVTSLGFLGANAQLKLQADNIPQIVKAMSLDEKLAMISGIGDQYSWAYEKNPEKIVIIRGQVGGTKKIDRLGIPHTVLNDGPAGLYIDTIQEGLSFKTYATAFPSATTLAATWNQDLVHQVGESIGEQVLEYGSDIILSPGMNIQRNPLAGRNFEYFSEDPYVSGMMAAAMVNGIQSKGVGACIKHFAANNIETNRMQINAVISQRALREIYLRGFELALKNSNPWMVMTAYNKLNGFYTPESPDLLQTILRKEWNYQGLVVTDWAGGKDHMAQMRAGNALLMPGNPGQTRILKNGIQSGLLNEHFIDAHVTRILEYVVKTPRFANYQFSNQPDLKKHGRHSREAAEEGMVLLENKNRALPFTQPKEVALFGKTSYHFIAGGTGSGRVNYRHAPNLEEAFASQHFGIHPVLKSFYSQYNDSVQSLGSTSIRIRPKNIIDFSPEPAISRDMIAATVKTAGYAVITIGRNAGELWDREELGYFTLSETESALIKNVTEIFQAHKKKVVVVLNVGSSIETKSWSHLPDAVLWAGQAGQDGALALVHILTGKVNPSGKLALSFPEKYSDIPSAKNFPGTPQHDPQFSLYEEGIYVGYRFHDAFKVKPSYPFGYGLSYTQFSFSNPHISETKVYGDRIQVSVRVTNTGKKSGKEVVQLYVSAPESIDKPFKELKGFAKTRLLQPGQSENISLSIAIEDLASFHTASHQWIADKGNYTLRITGNTALEATQINLELPYTRVVKDCYDVLYPNRLVRDIKPERGQ